MCPYGACYRHECGQRGADWPLKPRAGPVRCPKPPPDRGRGTTNKCWGGEGPQTNVCGRWASGILHIYPSALQGVWTGPAATLRFGVLGAYATGSMHDPAYGLPRRSIPRPRVNNEGKIYGSISPTCSIPVTRPQPCTQSPPER